MMDGTLKENIRLARLGTVKTRVPHVRSISHCGTSRISIGQTWMAYLNCLLIWSCNFDFKNISLTSIDFSWWKITLLLAPSKVDFADEETQNNCLIDCTLDNHRIASSYNGTDYRDLHILLARENHRRPCSIRPFVHNRNILARRKCRRTYRYILPFVYNQRDFSYRDREPANRRIFCRGTTEPANISDYSYITKGSSLAKITYTLEDRQILQSSFQVESDFTPQMSDVCLGLWRQSRMVTCCRVVSWSPILDLSYYVRRGEFPSMWNNLGLKGLVGGSIGYDIGL